MAPICRLPASGFTETPVAVLEWADRAVTAARQKLNGAEPVVAIAAYRHANSERLCCGVYSVGTSNVYGITLVTGDGVNLDHIEEPHVADMADALHMIGIVIEALQGSVTVGRRGNEVNPEVLARTLGSDERNGAIQQTGSSWSDSQIESLLSDADRLSKYQGKAAATLFDCARVIRSFFAADAQTPSQKRIFELADREGVIKSHGLLRLVGALSTSFVNKRVRLPDLSEELYEHYGEMSAQTHEAEVKAYARASMGGEKS